MEKPSQTGCLNAYMWTQYDVGSQANVKYAPCINPYVLVIYRIVGMFTFIGISVWLLVEQGIVN